MHAVSELPSRGWSRQGKVRQGQSHTLQKSIDFTPLEPRAGPTGGEGEAWPAPTMSLTIWSVWIALRAMVVCWCVGRRVNVVCACFNCDISEVSKSGKDFVARA